MPLNSATQACLKCRRAHGHAPILLVQFQLCCCRTTVVTVSVRLVAKADMSTEKSFLVVRQVSELAGVDLTVDAFRR